MERTNISSGSLWEERVGYSRLVRVGSFVYVSETTAADEQGGAASESAYHQTTLILTRIQDALAQVGARLEDVVRTRIYVIDMTTGRRSAEPTRSSLGRSVRPRAWSRCVA